MDEPCRDIHPVILYPCNLLPSPFVIATHSEAFFICDSMVLLTLSELNSDLPWNLQTLFFHLLLAL